MFFIAFLSWPGVKQVRQWWELRSMLGGRIGLNRRLVPAFQEKPD
jgi:hypothetical protein